MGSSELFAHDVSTLMAKHGVKRSVGSDEQGNTVYSDGDILLETVNLFKGQTANVIVLVGRPQNVDSQMERNSVFVRMAQARSMLSLID